MMSYAQNRTARAAAPMDLDPISGHRLGGRHAAAGRFGGRHTALRLGRWLAGSTPYAGALIAIGGLLTVLAYAVGGNDIAERAGTLLNDGSLTRPGTWAALMIQTGASTLLLLAPVAGGYVAYGIADRQGILPGVIGGVVAMVSIGGFLGGIVAGVIAGAVTVLVRRFTGRLAGRGAVAMALVPTVSTAVTAATVFVVIGPRVAALANLLWDRLPPLTGGSAAVCGLVLGLMVGADLSGTISRVAVAFAATGVQVAPNNLNFTIMATVTAAGMVAPLALSLATGLSRGLFTPAERSYGKVAWLLGVAAVPEGAVPFALADPLRVLPATLAGGAVTGTLTMTFGSTMTSSTGGFFAAAHLGKPMLFTTALAAGVLVAAAVAITLKSLWRPMEEASSPRCRLGA
jgi:fructose-specific phosphotransferase system IIC component